MIITVSGLAGAGKGTVCRILSEKLGFKYYSMGDLRRMMAKDRGLTIEEFNKLGEDKAFTDIDADNYQKELGKKDDNFIMEGRLSYHFIPNSIKLFLSVEPKVAASRIYNDKSSYRINQQKAHSLLEQEQLTIERNESDIKRYKKYYGVENITDPKNFDLYIDTSNLTVQEVVDKIMAYVDSRN